MNLKKLMIALLKSSWPGGATAPTAGTMKGESQAIPNNNIDLLSDASTTAAIVAASHGNIDLPISTVKVTVT